MAAETIKFQQWTCILESRQFVNGGYRLDLIEHKTGEPVATCNVWLPDVHPSEVAVDTNNYPEMPEVLIAAGIIFPQYERKVQSGLCQYPVYRLVPLAYKGLTPEALYERQVTDALIDLLGIDNGDAQGMVECAQDKVKESWDKALLAQDAAKLIAGRQPSDAWTTMLLVDGDRVSLYDFMRDNWEPHVDHLSEQDMREIFALRVGQECKLNLGAHGTTSIKRIG